jgi:hypothetical protein
MAVTHGGPNAAIEGALSELDAEVKALQVRYEQYFLGLERREPADDRAALRKALMALKRENIRNTGLKFRLNSLWNKFLSYERMWNRTVKEIEEGRYRRDVFKAKLRGYDSAKAKQAAKKVEEALAQEGEAGESAEDGARPSVAAKAAAKAAAAPPGGLTDEKLDKLYTAFVTAKKKCREDVSGITRDAMANSLRKQLPTLQAKHKGRTVDFKVVIKGGKAILKAVPR